MSFRQLTTNGPHWRGRWKMAEAVHVWERGEISLSSSKFCFEHRTTLKKKKKSHKRQLKNQTTTLSLIYVLSSLESLRPRAPLHSGFRMQCSWAQGTVGASLLTFWWGSHNDLGAECYFTENRSLALAHTNWEALMCQAWCRLLFTLCYSVLATTYQVMESTISLTCCWKIWNSEYIRNAPKLIQLERRGIRVAKPQALSTGYELAWKMWEWQQNTKRKPKQGRKWYKNRKLEKIVRLNMGKEC